VAGSLGDAIEEDRGLATACYQTISNDILTHMSNERTPLFVRLPRNQAAALDRLAEATGRRKQSLVSELLGDRLTVARPLSVGRVEVSNTPEVGDEVLTLEEVAKLLKVPADAVRARAEEGKLPGRRFGKEWRFARMAVLAWLKEGESQNR
jgi:excisionase family DNA binding protein